MCYRQPPPDGVEQLLFCDILLWRRAGGIALARALAALRAGSRITDDISLGVIAKTFPMRKVRAVLAATDRARVRRRELPAHGAV